ncbi:MAG: restriction endonuclease subunit S [Desulfobacteraceae bacterium]|nr:restriction endonuclease subunit S [Desulfobacteraceae bacterium]
MAGEWEETTLADISSDVSYGYTESASEEKVGPCFLRITDIQNGIVNWANVPYCPISAENHQKYRLQEGDIVVARTGNSTGENFLYQGSEDAVFASYLIRFRIDRQKADPKFIWYNLRSRDWWNFINNSKTGSAQAGANAKILGLFPVNLPPLNEQRAIAHILGTLDDKIELNRRMNETLEAMAWALFKSWFVDFDPVRAKAEGRDPGLPKPLADLFPDSFEDSELGEIPKGWKVKTIGDLAEVVGGSTPSTTKSAFWDGGLAHWATPKDLSSLGVPVLLNTERRITDAGLAQISSGLLPVGTVLLSSRAPIGYLAIAEVPVAINQGFIAMKPHAEISNLFLLLWARSAHDEIVSRANGSTFLEISKANFRPIPIVTPPANVMSRFDHLVRPIYECIVERVRESNTLASLVRDTLLPKLISGELLVPKTSEILNEVVP